MNALVRHVTSLILALFCLLANAQDYMTNRDSVFYFTPTSELSGWNELGFDDSAWNLGASIIGFDEGANLIDTIHTIIPQAQTIYTRSYFNIDTISNYTDVSFFIDYDDAFIAYINGVEFARVGMGKHGSEVTYDQLADRSSESKRGVYFQVKTGILDPNMTYYVDEAFIDSVFQTGLNVLSVEVHNDSIDGSDLISYGYLVDRTNATFDMYNTYDKNIRCLELDSTHLPIIHITTGELGVPQYRVEVEGYIKVINSGGYNKPDDSVFEHEGPIYIETRGQSSAQFPKKSYDIELQDEEWNDTSVSILGMPRESDWVLQGPYADKSQFRNALIYDMARKTGNWAPRIKFCEVIFNGEFIGLYNLTEKIKRDSNRIDLARLRTEEISGNDVTGGYILKYDKPNSSLQIVYPKEHNLQPEQDEYIRGFIADYHEVLFSNDGLDPEIGYKRYIDENTLIDYMIISEFGKNCDSYLNSTFFYKDRADRDNRLKIGPIWDFDLCFGNASWQSGDVLTEWQFANRRGPRNNKFSIERILQDPEFADSFAERWSELRENFLSDDSINIVIDTIVDYLEPALVRNYRVYPVIHQRLFFPVYETENYDDELAHIKNWISNRTTWIDQNIGEIYYPITEYASNMDENFSSNSYESMAYPNPFTDDLFIDLHLPESGVIEVELLDIQGKTIGIIANSQISSGDYKIYWNSSSANLHQGMYFISIKVNGELYEHLKVLHLDK